jgi:diacylglycerol kinase family enzyme
VKLRAILNRGGGSAMPGVEERLRARFADAGADAEIRVETPESLAEAFRQAAAAEGLDAVVAGGGDGTIGTAAAALAGTGRPLGIVPLGTLNHFARDAGIPLDLEGAVATIVDGAARPVDLAEVNGRVFVNNSAVGLYPRMVREREDQQHRLGRGKRLAMLVAGARVLWRFSHRRLTLRIGGFEAPVATPLLFVGNNRYEMGLLSLGRREAIDRGELCLYAPLARSRAQFVHVALRAVLGRADRQEDFLSISGIGEIEVESRHRYLTVSTDGEAVRMETPLRYRSRPGELRLIVPREAERPAG